jgi:hypothetical protein
MCVHVCACAFVYINVYVRAVLGDGEEIERDAAGAREGEQEGGAIERGDGALHG